MVALLCSPLLKSYAMASPAFSSALPIHIRILGIVGMALRAMCSALLPTVQRSVLRWRQRFQMHWIAASAGRTSMFGPMVNMPTIRDRADCEFISQSVSANDLAFDRDTTVATLGGVPSEGPAIVGTSRLVDIRPEVRDVVELASFPAHRATARTKPPVPRVRLLASTSCKKWGAALLAGTGILEGHCRDPFGDVTPPAVTAARGFSVPELYQIWQGMNHG